MPSSRPLAARLIVVALGLGLWAGVQLGIVPGSAADALARRPSEHRSSEHRAAVVTQTDDAACPEGDGAGGAPAALGARVEVDGIGVVLERPAGTSLGADTVSIRVDAKGGGPLTDALVFVSIRMPSMDHGVSAYPAREVEDGRYRADDVSLGMAGEWLVSVEVVRQARAPIAATYRLDIAEP